MSFFTDPTIQLILSIAAGFLIGALIGWMIARSRLDRRHAAALTEKRITIAGMNEALQAEKAALDQVKKALEKADHELRECNRTLIELTQAKATAQGRLERLSKLEETVTRREKEINELNQTIIRLKGDQVALETVLKKERCSTEEKIAMLEDIRSGLTDHYKALAAGVLRENSRAFLDLAGETFAKYVEATKNEVEIQREVMGNTVKPVEKALDRYDKQVQAMERSRETAYGGLTQQIDALLKTQSELQKETGRLARAMRIPHVRGRWGELTLRRTVELAGMSEHCDFTEQTSVEASGSLLRPDMIVRLPDNRSIVIDAKVPLSAYLDSLEADSPAKIDQYLDDHAKQVQSHIFQLAQKSYWTQFDKSPEFVVLFIPGENFFSAALTRNPNLIEIGAARRVIPATPTTLISLLKTVAMGWHQVKASENAKKIGVLGKELYERLHAMLDHVNRLGKDLERSSASYNKLVGSLSRRVIVSARKFNELGVASRDEQGLLDANPIETAHRQISLDNETESESES